MRWPFADRWKKTIGLEKSDGKKIRKRHTRARLIDLLCNLKRRTVIADSHLHGAQFDDHRSFYLNESPPSGHPSMDDLASWDSFCDLPSHHSSSLKRRIPPPTVSMRPSLFLATKQCDLCSTCGNTVTPSPRKFCRPLLSAKRIRPSMLFVSPTNCGSDTLDSRREEQAAAAGHFNPTYASVHSDDSGDSIYSNIAESSNTFEGQRQVFRPRLFGARRLDTFRGIDITLDDWLLKNGDGAHSPADPTYSTVLPSEYEVPVSTSGSEGILGDPCMSSTLKRGVRSTDDGTIYDEVASDFEDGVFLFKPVRMKRSANHHYAEFAPHLSDQVKRVRREYFVCEE